MRRHALLIGICVTSLLTGCGSEQVSTYRQDHKAFLKELIYCENHYAAQKDSDGCRAAFKVNSELFPE
jgi:hypothetical protein